MKKVDVEHAADLAIKDIVESGYEAGRESIVKGLTILVDKIDELRTQRDGLAREALKLAIELALPKAENCDCPECTERRAEEEKSELEAVKKEHDLYKTRLETVLKSMIGDDDYGINESWHRGYCATRDWVAARMDVEILGGTH